MIVRILFESSIDRGHKHSKSPVICQVRNPTIPWAVGAIDAKIVLVPVVQTNLLGQRGASCGQRRLDSQDICPRKTPRRQKHEFQSLTAEAGAPPSSRVNTVGLPTQKRSRSNQPPFSGKCHSDRLRTRNGGRRPSRAAKTANRWPRCIKPRNTSFWPINTSTLCLWSPAKGTSWV